MTTFRINIIYLIQHKTFSLFLRIFCYLLTRLLTAWKVSKYGVFFWSALSCIRTQNTEIYEVYKHSNNSVFGHFSRSVYVAYIACPGTLRTIHYTPVVSQEPSYFVWFPLQLPFENTAFLTVLTLYKCPFP